MSLEKSEATRIEGERGATAVSKAPSLQARISNWMAVSLMGVLGVGLLSWYYASAVSRSARVREAARVQSTQRVSAELPLPSLGRIDAPVPRVQGTAPPVGDHFSPLGAEPLREIPLEQYVAAHPPVSAPPIKTPEELALERQLSGSAFAVQGGAVASPVIGAVASGAAAMAPDDLNTLLKPTTLPATSAQVLATQQLMLPKGAFIDCTLETAIDSTLPGMTTCIIASDAFGVDGKVVLLERGTKLVGETRGQVQQGSARVFVVWSEARTPTGVIVPLASPGADELGRAGLPGEVNRHFWQRFGAALLVSVVEGSVSAVASNRGGGAVVVNPSATQDVMTEVLKNTVNIAPTVVKHQGDRVQVLVARDVDFRSVYELRNAEVGR